MNGAVILESAGLALSVFVSSVFVIRPGISGRRRYLVFPCAQAGLIFAKELMDSLGEGRLDRIVTFLIYADFLYGVPSMYFYLRSVYGLASPERWKHYLPAIANFALAAIFSSNCSGSRGIDGSILLRRDPSLLLPFQYANLLAAAESLQVGAYAIGGLRIINGGGPRGRKRLPDRLFFSVLACYGAYYAVRWSGLVARLMSSGDGVIAPTPRWAGPAMVMTVAVFMVLLGFRIIANFEEGPRGEEDPPAKPKYGGKEMNAGESRRIVDKVRGYLVRAEDLSDESVTPRLLAESLGIPYYLLSRSVNERCAMSVSDLIREHRIEKAKRMLDSRPEATILEIALDSGFSAKSSFYDAFKRLTGMSPSEYQLRARGRRQGGS